MFPSFLVTLSLVVILAVALLVGFVFYIYWWLVQRPVPKLDGIVSLDCLDAEVEVRYDRHAIPHVYAHSHADMFRAQGFIHAQNRMWQMEQARRIAYGTLAEVFGDVALDADRFSRTIGFRRAAEEELLALDAEMQQVLAWYADGVNGYIRGRKGKLAAEFNLLRIAPQPWTPLDSVAFGKVMNWSLSLNWESELTRLRLSQRVGPIRAADLEPDYPDKNPIALEGVGSAETTRLLATAGLLLNEYEGVKSWFGVQGESRGSNAWVLAPKASQTRRPLLCNDPHLQVQIPGIWYESHLTSPEYNVSGATMPGIPGVMIGHNEDIAWGMTNGQVDVQDLYVERRHPHDPTLFAYEDGWEKAEVIEERISIRRRAEPHLEQVVVTRHGPLISGFVSADLGDLGGTHDALALQWTAYAPGQTLRSVLRLNKARNWEQFSAAMQDWAGPPQNVVFADVRGNIGYVLAGDIPVRTNNLGLLPAPGWDGNHEWDGLIPRDELPRLYNPPSGMIVTANNKITGDDYAHFMGVEFLPGWRAARIEEMLGEKERHKIGDMERIQLDTTSRFAIELTPWLTLLDSDDPWEKVALSHLRKWNHRLDPESTAALVFHYTLQSLLDLVFGDKLADINQDYLGISQNPLFLIHGFMLRATTRLLELLSNCESSVWYMDASTGRHRTREELLQAALTRAVRRIRRDLGDSARRWNWGRIHQVRYVHPLGSVRLFRSMFNRGPFPVGGDATTPNLAAHVPNVLPGLVQVTASYRQIFDVGVWDRAQSVLASGQSGHPLSEHYDDQIPVWREGQYHPMPWGREEVAKQTLYLTSLRPTQ